MPAEIILAEEDQEWGYTDGAAWGLASGSCTTSASRKLGLCGIDRTGAITPLQISNGTVLHPALGVWQVIDGTDWSNAI